MVPASVAGAPADLAVRFSSVLASLKGRSVSTDALFEALRLEALDWGFDHDIDTQIVGSRELVTADEEEA